MQQPTSVTPGAPPARHLVAADSALGRVRSYVDALAAASNSPDSRHRLTQTKKQAHQALDQLQQHLDAAVAAARSAP